MASIISDLRCAPEQGLFASLASMSSNSVAAHLLGSGRDKGKCTAGLTAINWDGHLLYVCVGYPETSFTNKILRQYVVCRSEDCSATAPRDQCSEACPIKAYENRASALPQCVGLRLRKAPQPGCTAVLGNFRFVTI